MKRSKQTLIITVLAVILSTIFIFGSVGHAIQIVLEPAEAQREVGGKVRLLIYADNATDLISMGVTVSFEPAILQVDSAFKFEDFDNGWIMDSDGDQGTINDQYTTPDVDFLTTPGIVTMIGGRLMGTNTLGLSGKVLLGWINFTTIANGTSYINVDLGRYHPNHPTQTYDNFVTIGGVIDEPTNVPAANLGTFCVVAGACNGDYDTSGAVDVGDLAVFAAAFGSLMGQPNYNPAADFDSNGAVDVGDLAVFANEFSRTNCPSCP